MATPQLETIWDLPRNDIDACHRYWLEHPNLTGEDWRVMIRLQDKPAALIEAAKRWRRVQSGSEA